MPKKKPTSKFKDKGDDILAKGHLKYWNDVVLVNSGQGIEDISKDMLEFYISGYQVYEKWLKDRRGRELSADDSVHYGKMVTAMGETIHLMSEVMGRMSPLTGDR